MLKKSNHVGRKKLDTHYHYILKVILKGYKINSVLILPSLHLKYFKVMRWDPAWQHPY